MLKIDPSDLMRLERAALTPRLLAYVRRQFDLAMTGRHARLSFPATVASTRRDHEYMATFGWVEALADDSVILTQLGIDTAIEVSRRMFPNPQPSQEP